MTKYLRPAFLSLCLIATAAAAPAAMADDRYDHRGSRYEQRYAPPVAYRHGILSERQVAWRLRHQGYHRVHDVDLRRGHYTARARDGYGRPVFLVVSARSGAVLRARRAW